MPREKLSDGFNFEFNFGSPNKDKEPEEIKEGPEAVQVHKVKRGTQRHHTRRFASEYELSRVLDWHLEKGCSYHCISMGDVDSLSYLRQQKLDYCLISTWAIAMTDAIEMTEWIEKGYVKRIDFYVGEIFNSSYAAIYDQILNHCLVPESRICMFKNHSKVMVGYGEKFDFVIESSANVNTNPRTEQCTIILDTELADFYKNFFDGIKAFNQIDTRGFKPWEKNKNS